MTLALDYYPYRDTDCGDADPAPRRLSLVPDVDGPAARPPAAVSTGTAATSAAATGTSVAVLRAPAGREVEAPVRLTHRGVAVVALAVALLGGVLVWLAAASAPSSSPAPAVPAAVTVHAGDTVWAIAARYAGSQDPGALVSTIQRLNHLEGAQVAPGQVLRLR